MATSRATSKGVVDKATQDAINGMLLGMVSGMTKEAAKLMKKAQMVAEKEVIGETTSGTGTTRGDRKRKQDSLNAYLRAQREKNKFFGKMWQSRWSQPFLKIWFNMVNSKLYRSIADAFNRVTGFIRQQFDDIFGEFAPLVSFIKDIFVSIKDVFLGAASLFWKGVQKSFGFIRKIFSLSGWAKGFKSIREAIEKERKELGAKLDKLNKSLGRKTKSEEEVIVKRKRGRPKRGAKEVAKEVADTPGFFTSLIGMISGGIIGKLLTSTVGLLLTGLAGFGLWKWISGWLESHPGIKKEVDAIKEFIWKTVKSVFSVITDAVVDGAKAIWAALPGWGQLSAISVGILWAVKKIADAYNWLQTMRGVPSGAAGGAGGAAGGAGGAAGGKGAPAGKGGGKGGFMRRMGARSLPVVGTAIAGALDYWATGSMYRAGGAMAGSAVGGAIGMALGTALGLPAVGGFIGASIGGVAGDIIGEKLEKFAGGGGGGVAHAGQIPSPVPGMSAEEVTAFKQRVGMKESAGGKLWAPPVEKSGEQSGARGKYQFTPSTWNSLATKIGVEQVTKSTKDTDLDPRKNVDNQEKVMDEAVRYYSRTLQAAGLPVTPGNLYLCHFLGAEKAVKALKAGKDAVIDTFLSDEGKRLNRTQLGKTVGQFVSEFDKGKFTPPTVAGGGEMGILGSILSGILGDPLAKALFGEDVGAIDNLVGGSLTREEMAARTGDTGQGVGSLKSQEAALSSQQTAGQILSDAVPQQYAAPAGASMTNPGGASLIGAPGTPDPSPSLLTGGTPMYVVMNNAI